MQSQPRPGGIAWAVGWAHQLENLSDAIELARNAVAFLWDDGRSAQQQGRGEHKKIVALHLDAPAGSVVLLELAAPECGQHVDALAGTCERDGSAGGRAGRCVKH